MDKYIFNDKKDIIITNKSLDFNLQPFNEPQYYSKGTEYADCFYSSLFMFLNTYNKSLLPYISNNIFHFNYNYNTFDLRLKYGMTIKSLYPLEKLFSNSNIKINLELVDAENIVPSIIKNINMNIFCSIAVDMYYLPFREDRYKKIHSTHYINICGYDITRNILKIIDNPQNTIYYPLEVSLFDCLLAFESSQKENENYLISFIPLSSNVIAKEIDYTSIFKKNFKDNSDLIKTNIDYLNYLIQDVQRLKDKPLYHQDRSMNLFDLIHFHILNKKRSEKYAYYKLLNNPKILETEDITIKKWEKIRDICYLFFNEKKTRYYLIDILTTLIEEVITLEIVLFQIVYTELKNK